VKVYCVPPLVKSLLALKHCPLRVIQMGQKLFVKHESPYSPRCAYRFSQDGISLIAPHVTKRLVIISESDMEILLTETDPFFTVLSPTAFAQLIEFDQGSIVFKVDICSNVIAWTGALLAGWRGKASCQLHLSKIEREALLQFKWSLETLNNASILSKKKSSKFIEDSLGASSSNDVSLGTESFSSSRSNGNGNDNGNSIILG